MPDEDTRAQLWERMLPANAPRTGPFDFRTLGRNYKFSGGFIRNAVLRAAYLAAAELEAWEMGRVI